MCKFFSLVSNGDSKPLYFDAKDRKKILNKKLKYEADSHTSIANFFGYKGEKEDTLNKYEYNPITKVFEIDQKNNPVDDSAEIKIFCEQLDFKTIVPELIIHPIVHPFKDFKTTEVSKKDIELLRQWDSVRASIWDSVGNSVWDSVRASVGNSVWDSVRVSVRDSVRNSVRNSVRDSVGNSVWDSVRASIWDSVWDSVRASIWDSVGNSVWDSVRASVGNSVWDSVRASIWDSVWDSAGDSVWAYTSSYFNLPEWKYIKHKKGENPFQSCIDLWNKGLVPSFDGKIWRLHGAEGKVVFEISKEDLISKVEPV